MIRSFLVLAFILYGTAMVGYAISLFSRKSTWEAASAWLAWAGWIGHALALTIRWVDAGFSHPPCVGGYELLLFFSWVWVAVFLYMDLTYRIAWAGLLPLAIVVCLMGLALIHPNTEIIPLSAVFGGKWLLFHVLTSSVGLACLLFSSVLAIYALAKTMYQKGNLLLALSSLSVLLFSISGPEMAEELGHGRWNLLSYLFEVSIFLYFLQILLGMFSRNGFLLFLGGTAVGSLFLGIVLFKVNLGSVPYSFYCTFLILVLNWMMVGFAIQPKALENKLPELEKIDRVHRQMAGAGFPLLTVGMISGAAWGFISTGQYWIGATREIWILATWFFYGSYVHLRFFYGWKGRKASIYAAAGFFLVVLSLLGVGISQVPFFHSILAG